MLFTHNYNLFSELYEKFDANSMYHSSMPSPLAPDPIKV